MPKFSRSKDPWLRWTMPVIYFSKFFNLMFANSINTCHLAPRPTLQSESPGTYTERLSCQPSGQLNLRAASEAPTLGSQVARSHTVLSHSASDSRSVSEVPPADYKRSSKKTTKRAQLKATTTAPVLDTVNLAHQHFYYLLLKDPFASREQHLGLAQEAFSRAFGEKSGLQFEVTQDMLQVVSAILKFVCRN
jgi:hypothetical protein